MTRSKLLDKHESVQQGEGSDVEVKPEIKGDRAEGGEERERRRKYTKRTKKRPATAKSETQYAMVKEADGSSMSLGLNALTDARPPRPHADRYHSASLINGGFEVDGRLHGASVEGKPGVYDRTEQEFDLGFSDQNTLMARSSKKEGHPGVEAHFPHALNHSASTSTVLTHRATRKRMFSDISTSSSDPDPPPPRKPSAQDLFDLSPRPSSNEGSQPNFLLRNWNRSMLEVEVEPVEDNAVTGLSRQRAKRTTRRREVKTWQNAEKGESEDSSPSESDSSDSDKPSTSKSAVMVRATSGMRVPSLRMGPVARTPRHKSYAGSRRSLAAEQKTNVTQKGRTTAQRRVRA